MSCKPLFALLATVVLFAPAVPAQTLPSGVQKNASVGGVTEYDYPNGLRVLLYPDTANPKVTVNMVYLVGSRHEGYGESGMAHLLERMNFVLTTSGRNVKKELTDHGANWNGTSDVDRTNYFETVTASDDNLTWALGLEADRMVNMRIEKQLLDTEMTAVRNEFELRENRPESLLEERVAAAAFLLHNYGKSTIGSKEDIERVSIDHLAAFYRKYYQPDNAALVIAGQLDESKTLQYVADTLGQIPRPTRRLDQTYIVEPAQDGERYVELRGVGRSQSLMMAYHAPAAVHPDAEAFQVLTGIMSGGTGGGAEGRLTKALVDSKLADTARMRFEQLHDPGLVEFTANLNKDQSLDAAKKAILDTIDGIVAQPPTQQEVDSVKAGMLRNLETSLADTRKLGVNGLTDTISQGDWRLLFLQRDRLQKVASEDLVRVAKLYLRPSNMTVGYYIPDPSVTSEDIYRHHSDFRGSSGARNLEVQTTSGGALAVKGLGNYSVPMADLGNGPTYFPDALGSTNIHVVIDKSVGYTDYAGLHFKQETTVNIWKDGSVEVDKENIEASDKSGLVWISKKVTIDLGPDPQRLPQVKIGVIMIRKKPNKP